jgi:hypothetical protein
LVAYSKYDVGVTVENSKRAFYVLYNTFMDLSKYQTKQFVITNKESEEYGEWVKKTAQLLGRPYAQIHTIFTKEGWTLDKMRTRYMYVTKHNGDIPSPVLWWYLRKKDKGV